MRIALVGPQNSGKTTLFELMKKEPMFKGYHFFSECLSDVDKFGFKINEGATGESQLAMAALHMRNLSYPHMVTDRCILDNYIYAEYLSEKYYSINSKIPKFLLSLLNETINMYDFIYYCNPDFKMEDNGFRSTDKQFQTDIHNLFMDFLKTNNFPNVRYLSGETKDRLQTFKEY